MGALAMGGDFVKSKLVTRKELIKRKQEDQKSTTAFSAPGPSNAPGHSGATALSSPPSLFCTPVSSAPTATTKVPLRILKLSPAQFAAVQKAKLEREATTTSTPAKVARMCVKSDAKVETVPQPSYPIMPPFPFSQFMPNQPSNIGSMSPANSEEHGSSTTVMWQAYSMSTLKK